MKIHVLLLVLCLVLAPFVTKYASAEDETNEVEVEDAAAPSRDGFNEEERAAVEKSAEKHVFNAEVNKLMNIIVNSLYTNNEVFLRELISNSNDALDKIRFLSLTDKQSLGDTEELHIRLKGDEEANTLTITDTGVGMTRDDLIQNLGTIAQSGTKDFLSKFQEYSDSNLIGQFGVGFYSVFLVADSVTVLSKHNDDDQYVWQSSADGSFTITKDPRGNTLGRGTSIIISLKDDAREYSRVQTLRQLVAKHSQFINFPIELWTSKQVTNEVELTEEERAEKRKEMEEELAERLKKEGEDEDEEEEEESLDEEDGDAEEEEEATIKDEDVPTTKSVTETVWEWEQLNTVKPLWSRPAGEVTEEEYKEFYKSAMKDYTDPLKWVHFAAEGEIEFKALLYIPAKAPPGMFDGTGAKDNMRLFVRRVFVTDDFSDILPKFLSFIKGLVDSDDLPLNVSREQLQQHKTLKIIKKKLVRKAIAMIQELWGTEQWDAFYEQYSTALKLGAIEDQANRGRISKLLQFRSSKTGEMTSFQEYVDRMKKKQEDIYYLGGESVEAIENSPLLERLKRRGFEVLYMLEPIDEYVMQNLGKFDGKHQLINAGREGLKLPGDKDDEEAEAAEAERFEPLISWLKDVLATKVDKVVLSKRLTTSPAALSTSSFGASANMQRIMKAQALGDPSQKNNYMFQSKAILELNPRHPVVQELLAKVEANEEDPEAHRAAEVLFETGRLTSGFGVDSPAEFAEKINALLAKSFGVENVEVELEDIEEEEEEEEEAVEEEEAEEEAAEEAEEEATEESHEDL